MKVGKSEIVSPGWREKVVKVCHVHGQPSRVP